MKARVVSTYSSRGQTLTHSHGRESEEATIKKRTGAALRLKAEMRELAVAMRVSGTLDQRTFEQIIALAGFR